MGCDGCNAPITSQEAGKKPEFSEEFDERFWLARAALVPTKTCHEIQVATSDLKPQQMFGFSRPAGAKNQTSVPK